MNITNPGLYSKHSDNQKEYMDKYAGVKSDVEIGSFTGLSKSQVWYYRSRVMQVNSVRWRKPINEPDNGDVRLELEALIQYAVTYNGCMREILELRIKELNRKII